MEDGKFHYQLPFPRYCSRKLNVMKREGEDTFERAYNMTREFRKQEREKMEEMMRERVRKQNTQKRV